ncbi:hypothetical protein Rsub_07099 [Raphidocelis subcapitata]|uniref:Succinate dehydrogenase assembly factor 4, mitochondrial n=1 Tax=Raphidocelis subcapitata TaxID=307507 RepID=A0A2V0P5C0_9CHLO|nr:hypothetical protein Rsub_07099 [Raphidocelis subcapitata]|eukprot:GBF94112.1 hypothetical protein Rsub_07099 [Raphidocelis subcapitata]
MALRQAWRALLGAAHAPRATVTAQQAAAAAAAAAAGPLRALHASSPPAAGADAAGPGASPGADPFTASLQSKVEQELAKLLEQRLAAEGSGDESGGEEAGVDPVHPETGEVGGPKGKEPTRFGDWERGGRAIDF